MSTQSTSVPFSIFIILDKLNNAKRTYDQTTNQHEKQQADRTFADCYDWLTTHHIPIYYDQESNLWLRSLTHSLPHGHS